MQKTLNSHTETDEQLFSLVSQGNKVAFTKVYYKYHKLLYVLAYRYLMNRDWAEDAVQSVFVRLWEYRSGLDIKLSLRNFLLTMMKNYVLNMVRSKNTALARQYEMSQLMSEYEDDLVEKLERDERLDLLYDALNHLSVQKRRICLMKMESEMSNQEIARHMNLSVNTIKTHYGEALKFIRRYIGKMQVLAVLVIRLIKFMCQ